MSSERIKMASKLIEILRLYLFVSYNRDKALFSFIITEHESLHQKKQFDWTLRGHDPLKTRRSFFDVNVTLPGNRC